MSTLPPSLAFHTCTVLSSEPDAIRCPFGDHATVSITSECPRYVKAWFCGVPVGVGVVLEGCFCGVPVGAGVVLEGCFWRVPVGAGVVLVVCGVTFWRSSNNSCGDR